MIPPSVATNLATTPFLSQGEDKGVKGGNRGTCWRPPRTGALHSLQLGLLPRLDQLRGDAGVQQHPVHQLHVTCAATRHWRPDAQTVHVQAPLSRPAGRGDKEKTLDKKQECDMFFTV